MKTYAIQIIRNTQWVEIMITSKYLSIGDNYYHFETQEGKHHYYPINYTIVTEI